MTARGQNETLSGGGYGSSSGISIRYKTQAEPGNPRPNFGGGLKFDSARGVLHRVEIDDASRSFFGYDLLVEPIPGSKQCRVTISALSLSAAEVAQWLDPKLFHVDSSYTPVLLPRYPPPQSVDPADAIALDLMVSADRKQKVVDYLQVGCKKPFSGTGVTEEAPRDLTAESIEFRVQSPALRVNGNAVETVPAANSEQGPVAWFAFPSKGKFLISLTPRPGYSFVRAGSLRGNRIAFDWKGDHYDISGVTVLLAAKRPLNIYVMRDERYEARANSWFGCVQRVEDALNSH